MDDRTCIEEDCSTEQSARGLCNAHYSARRRNGTPMPPKLDIAARPGIHSLSSIDRETRTATCSVCGPVTGVRFRNPRKGRGNKPGCPVKHPGAGWSDGYRFGKSRRPDGKGYSISVADLERIRAKQRGRCAICQRSETQVGAKLQVDHCHDTGRVRGLLCPPCNWGIGRLRDDPERVWRAFAYLTTA